MQEAEVGAQVTDERQQRCRFPDVWIFFLLQVVAEIPFQQQGQFPARQFFRLFPDVEAEPEVQCVHRPEEVFQEFLFLLELFVFLFEILSFQGIVGGDDSLGKQPEEAVTGQAHRPPVFLKRQDVRAVVPIERSGAIRLPLVCAVRVEVIQQIFRTDVI